MRGLGKRPFRCPRCVGAQLTFEPGADGRAARLILHQNGSDQLAERIA